MENVTNSGEQVETIKSKARHLVKGSLSNKTLDLAAVPEIIDENGPFDPHKEITSSDWNAMLHGLQEFKSRQSSYYPEQAAYMATIFPESKSILGFDKHMWEATKKNTVEYTQDTFTALEYAHFAELLMRIFPERRDELLIDQMYPQLQHALDHLTNPNERRIRAPLPLATSMLRLFPDRREEILNGKKPQLLKGIGSHIAEEETMNIAKFRHPDMGIHANGDNLSDELVSAMYIFPDQFASLDLNSFLWRDMRSSLQNTRDLQAMHSGLLLSDEWKRFTHHAANMTELARGKSELALGINQEPLNPTQKMLPEKTKDKI